MAGRFNGLVNKLPSTQAQFIWSNVPAYELVPMCNPTPDCNTFRWSRLDAAPSPGPRHQQDQLSVHSAGAAPVIIMTLHGGGGAARAAQHYTEKISTTFYILHLFIPSMTSLPQLCCLLQIADPYITSSPLSALYQDVHQESGQPSCCHAHGQMSRSSNHPPPLDN